MYCTHHNNCPTVNSRPITGIANKILHELYVEFFDLLVIMVTGLALSSSVEAVPGCGWQGRGHDALPAHSEQFTMTKGTATYNTQSRSIKWSIFQPQISLNFL